MKNNNPGLKLSNSNNYNHSTTEDIKFSLEELLTGQVGGDDSPEYHDFSGASTILDASQSAVYSTILNPPTATINVNYYGFSEAAKNAFEYAVNIWEGWIKSDIAIEVDAYWEDLSQYGSNILGAASPNGFRSNFAGATQNDTSYVMSLANHLAGKDLNGDGAEIKVWLNSSFNNWYLATDGKPGNKYDFTTVVLHELGHGFGITDLINSSGTGTYGTTIYERFIVNGDNQSLDTFFNNSSELKTQLRSNDLFFNGKNAVEANGGEQVKLYAPGKWQYGSSIAHLDEATYSKGNPDALMTPELRAGEVIHNPGGITLGVLEDLGWDINQADTQSQIPQPQETQLPQSQETQSPQTIINFQDGEISSYVAQDDSKSVVNTIENNQGLEIINNGWKKFDFNYQVTKDTILEFEFNSLVKGEIQAIGLETNSKFDVNSDKWRIFQLEGKDNFGITDFKQDITGKGWQTYQIKLSDYFSQDININYLLFANDHDNGSKNAHSQWKNLRVYEQNQQTQPQAPVETQTPTETQPQPPVETPTQTSSEIPSINFQDGEISSYVAQDDSKSVVNTIENNQGLEIINNGWKKFDFNYQVTKDTILEFEFNSLVKGEIQAIGLETNSKFDVNSDKGRIFQLEGKDNFGITDFKQDVTGKGWQTYQIKLSDYFSQDININYLLFANDHDNGSKNAHSQWKNLRVYEQNQQAQPQAPVETQTPTQTQPQPQAPVETQTQTSSEIPSINFQDGEISSYVAQDDSKSVVNTIENNQGLEIINNGWKKFDFNYQVTKDTILEFEFNSLVKGEIQAIGLETNSKFDVNSDKGRIFQLEGKDNFGITDFKQDVTGKGWQTYQIKLSDYFSQDININYLLFANDHDNGSKNAHSQWKNLRVYEQNQQNQPQPQAPVETQTSTETQPQPQAPVETQTQTSSEIPSINFQDGEISSYVAQDDSKSVVNTIENNQGLEIINNGWKKFDFNYQVTKDTILEFEFNSLVKGEIQAIGLETNSKFDVNSDKGRIFQLEGKDNFGITDFKQDVTGKGWQTYKINVGDYFNGNINHLLFTNDHDNGSKNAHSQFRSIKIYEGSVNKFNLAKSNNDLNSDVLLTVKDSINNYNLSSYGGKNQDKGTFDISDDKTEVQLTGNSWKKLDITNYNITNNTVLKFEFQSNTQGEVQGIGFDNDNIINGGDRAHFLQVSGTQDWGIELDEYTIGSEWQTYEVRLGDYDISGNFNYLTLGNDHDVSNANAHSQFRNISLYEM